MVSPTTWCPTRNVVPFDPMLDARATLHAARGVRARVLAHEWAKAPPRTLEPQRWNSLQKYAVSASVRVSIGVCDGLRPDRHNSPAAGTRACAAWMRRAWV